ncbi:MAG: prolipoprotein diacylglyceryl transferase [bacterium]
MKKMYPILFRLGSFSIYSYGLMVAIGCLLGTFLAAKMAEKENIKKDLIFDFSFYALLSGIIGARIFYIIENFEYYLKNPLDIIKIYQGGLAFYGGLISAIFVTFLFFKKKKLPFLKTSDILIPFLVIGHSIGRIGCFLNGCCYGKETNSCFGIKFDGCHSVHPTQIYESIILLIIFFILLNFKKIKKFDGQVFFLYMILYSISRFFIELLRVNEKIMFNLSSAQIVSIILVIIGICLWLYFGKKMKGKCCEIK